MLNEQFYKPFWKTFILSLCFTPAYSQLDYDVFMEYNHIRSADSQKVFLSVYNLDYVKNNEYFGPMADGYTLYGYQLHPKITYFPNTNLRLDGGLYLLKEYGYNKFTQVLPTFTLKTERKGFELVFGNLESSTNHFLIEPLYNFERIFQNRLEYGSQIIINKPKFWFDGWLNWEKAIYKGAPFQEQLTIGFSSNNTLLHKTESFNLKLPIQALIFHRGGQIDIVDIPLVTMLNVATGLSFQFNFNDSEFITAFQSDNYFVYYRDLSFEKRQTYKEGKGLYLNYLLKTKYFLNFGLCYWKGERFIGPKGTSLYQSLSSKSENYSEPERNLVFLKLSFEHEFVPGLFLSTRFEPYYDLNRSLLEYSYGIYAVYRTDIFLTKVK